MRKLLKIAAMLFALPATLFFTACDDDGGMDMEPSDSIICFATDTLHYSFGVTSLAVREYTYNIPVKVVGVISAKKREVEYVVLPDSTNAVEDVHFCIGDAFVMPDSTDGVIPVTVYRNELKGNHIDGYDRYTIRLKLVGNKYFVTAPDSLNKICVFSFDNSVDKPEWYNAFGEKVWREDILGVWHPLKYIKMVEYFHAFEKIRPETYKKMVELYGENLEHIPFGEPYEYRATFKKYIYLKMYEFFEDPVNREGILAEFPDFLFDFPNPYDVW